MQRKRTMKVFHTLYLVVIAILLTLLFVERQGQRSSPEQQVLSEQVEALQVELLESVSALRTTMQTQFTELNTALERVSEADETYPRSLPASAQQPPLNRLQNESEPADLAEPPLTSSDYARLGAAVSDSFSARQDLFDMQSVDPDWAYPTRERIENLFYEHAYLRDMQLIEVECRSSICRIDLSAQDANAINPARLLQALNQLNSDRDSGHFTLNSQPQDFGYRVYVQKVD